MTGCTAIADTREMARAEWLQIRRGGIGGSEAGAVMGMSPWSSPLSVWADKRGLLPDRDENDAMEYGKRMEPVLRQWFRDEVHKGLIMPMECTVEEEPHVLRSTTWPWAIADLDGIVRWSDSERGFGVLELKTADRTQAKYWQRDELPDGYYCQVQHYMAVTGAAFAYVFALVGKRPVLRCVPANAPFIERLMKAESELWEMVESGTMPAPIGSDADTDTLSVLYSPGGSPELEVPELTEEMRAIVALKAEIKEREKKVDILAQKVKVRMENAERARADGCEATWSRYKKAHFEIDRLRKEKPEIAEQYTEKLPAERFSVRALKEE